MQEICDVVATQKGLVREQRAKSKHFSSEDPYFSPGFVSIRVTPPMHNKGIRRMTLPADTTVILQSPISCDAQRVQLEAACAAVARITSGYAEASVEISSTSEFAQLMATKHFREDFAATQGNTHTIVRYTFIIVFAHAQISSERPGTLRPTEPLELSSFGPQMKEALKRRLRLCSPRSIPL